MTGRHPALTALLLVTGCGTGLDGTTHGGGDATLTVTPATAAPGQRVALRFRTTEARGIAFSLSTEGEQGWTTAYYLTSDWGAPDTHTPSWGAVEDSEVQVWPTVGVLGPGPDHVIVPTPPWREHTCCAPPTRLTRPAQS